MGAITILGLLHFLQFAIEFSSVMRIPRAFIFE